MSLLSAAAHRLALNGRQAVWPFSIDWTDPESVGLAACYVASPHGMIDLVGGRLGDRGSSTADPSRANELGGIEAYFDGVSDSYGFGTDVLLSASSPFTVVWECLLDAHVDLYPFVASFARGVVSTPFRVVYSSDSNYDDINLCYGTGQGAAFLMPSGVTRAGMRHFGVWVYNGGGFSTAANHVAYINGLVCPTSTFSAISSITDETRIGGSALTSTDWNGGIRQVRVYPGVEWGLSDAIRFSAPGALDSLFRPERPARVYFLPAGSGPAVLEGAATGSATATGALSTAIQVNGAAASVVTATGGLTTSITFAGAAVSVTAAQGVLTAQIKLEGAALVQALAAAGLTTAVRLAGAAAGTVAATGALTTGSGGLSGAATGQATATGTVTTGISAAGAATAVVTATGGLTTGLNLAGAAQASVSAAAALTASIQLNGAAVAQATATGALTAGGGGLEGAAAATASAAGALSTAIPVLGAALMTSTATGALSSAIQLSGSAAAVSTATGQLTLAVALSGDAIARVQAAGSLTALIRLNGAAVARALAAATLSGAAATHSLYRTLTIPLEQRTLSVTAEQRVLSIAAEQRTLVAAA